MNLLPERRSFAIAPLPAAVLFGCLIFAVLPSGIVALNDDFGYLRSVVLTYQHGRPWTDDWLEPWSAGLTVLCSLAFRITGSFYFSTYGLLGLLAAASHYFGVQLLLSRGLSRATSILLAAIALTFPTVLWKNLEFTGMAIYIPCLISAWFFSERQRWLPFLAVWLLAISTRQSAVVWGILPAASALKGLVIDRRRMAPVTSAVTVGGAGLLFYLWMGRIMNKTHAQLATTDRMWSDWSWGHAAMSMRTGGALMLLCLGIAGTVSLLMEPRARSNLSVASPIRAILAASVASWLILGAHDYIAFDHEAFDDWFGIAYLKVLLCVSVAGIIFGRFSFNLLPAAAALVALAALTLRPAIWDYYAIDLIFFSILAWLPSVRAGAESNAFDVISKPQVWLLSAALALHLVFVAEFKHRLDRGHALCDLGCRALSQKLLKADEPSFIPFGLQGWYYFPYFIAHEGSAGADVGDFGRYLKQDCIDVAWRYAKPLRLLPGHGGSLPSDRRSTVLGGRYPYFWFFTQDFLILRAPPDRIRTAKSQLPADFQLPCFPCDDPGWKSLMNRKEP